MFFVSGKFKGVWYEGEFRNDGYNGKGIYYYADGKRYEGDYKNDKSNGKSVYYWSNGDWIEGEVKDGQW